jgi:glycosyltransferase involved in cell wall biosynthesis
MSVNPASDTVTVAYDASFDQRVIDEVSRAVGWVRFVPVADFAVFAKAAGDLGPNIALANGPGLFLLEALEAGVPAVVPTCEETRHYMREGGGILTGDDAPALADGIKRIVAMAPAARRVMGRIGRNHLLSLVS